MHALAVHGGAGTIQPGSLSPQQEDHYHQGIIDALQAGNKILSAGGSALDAVEAAVRSLEDNPLFNAGRGSVFTHDGAHELEASIMCGKTLKAGAAAGLQRVKNPVTLARTIMEKSDYVFLAGSGAEVFARNQQIEFAPKEYFFTRERYEELTEKQKKAQEPADERKLAGKTMGTVGAVALDVYGNLAAATSTGGLTNKQYGRIGDSPVIGGGTYANNNACAISCTGDGEFFIRSVAAHEVYSLVAYQSMPVQEACEVLIRQRLEAIAGEGGVIALDLSGNAGMAYNSPNMHRGYIHSDGTGFSAVFADKRLVPVI